MAGAKVTGVLPDLIITSSGTHGLEAGDLVELSGNLIMQVGNVPSDTTFLLMNPRTDHITGAGGFFADYVTALIVRNACALVTRQDDVGRSSRGVVMQWIRRGAEQ